MYTLYDFALKNLTAFSQALEQQTKKVRVRLYVHTVSKGVDL